MIQNTQKNLAKINSGELFDLSRLVFLTIILSHKGLIRLPIDEGLVLVSAQIINVNGILIYPWSTITTWIAFILPFSQMTAQVT